MSVTLADATKLNPHMLSASVFEKLALQSDLAKILPILKGYGQSYKVNRENALGRIDFRLVGAAYTEGATTYSQVDYPFKIFGGDVDTDDALIRREGGAGNLTSIRQDQLNKKIRKMKLVLHDKFINGDAGGAPEEFSGLKVLIAAGEGVKTTHGAAGTQILTSETTMLDFLQLMDEKIQTVPGASHAFMNAKMKAVMNRMAKKFGYYTSMPDSFGKLQEFYGGIQLISIGTKEDGTEIITNAETVGASTDCTSVYIAALNSDNGVTGVSTQDIASEAIVKDLGYLETSPAWRHRIDLDLVVAVQNKYAAHRIEGIRL